MSYHRTDTLSPEKNSEIYGSNLWRGESGRTKTIVLIPSTLAKMKIWNRFIHEIKGWLSMSWFWEGLIPFGFVLHQTWARHKIRGSKYFPRWGRHGNFREFTPNGVNSMSERFPISNRWWILILSLNGWSTIQRWRRTTQSTWRLGSSARNRATFIVG